MTMLEDLREVVRMVQNARPGTYDSIAHHCAGFIRTHPAQIEQYARDAARWRYMRGEIAEGRGSIFGLISEAIPDDSEDTPSVIEPLIDKGIDAAMAKESGNG